MSIRKRWIRRIYYGALSNLNGYVFSSSCFCDILGFFFLQNHSKCCCSSFFSSSSVPFRFFLIYFLLQILCIFSKCIDSDRLMERKYSYTNITGELGSKRNRKGRMFDVLIIINKTLFVFWNMKMWFCLKDRILFPDVKFECFFASEENIWISLRKRNRGSYLCTFNLLIDNQICLNQRTRETKLDSSREFRIHLPEYIDISSANQSLYFNT